MQEKEQNNSPIKQRILFYVDSLGISKRDFYSKTGISRGTLESKTGITEETLTKFFATYKNINSEWILTGSGEMLNSKFEESVISSKLEEEHAIYENSKLSDKEKIIQLEATIKELRGQVEYFRKLYEDAIKAK